MEDLDLSKFTELEYKDIDNFLSKQEEDELELLSLEKLFQSAYKKELFPAKILQMLADDMRHLKKVSLAKSSNDSRRLHFCKNLLVSNLQNLCL